MYVKKTTHYKYTYVILPTISLFICLFCEKNIAIRKNVYYFEKFFSFASINSADYLDFDTGFNQFETTEQCYHSYIIIFNSEFFSTKMPLLRK